MAIAPKKFSAVSVASEFMKLASRLIGVHGGNNVLFTAAHLHGGYQEISTDAAASLTVGAAENVRHTGTLTADRAVTLTVNGDCYAGAVWRITRTGGGAFNLNIGTGPLKALATNTWAEFRYDGTAWYLSAYGAL